MLVPTKQQYAKATTLVAHQKHTSGLLLENRSIFSKLMVQNMVVIFCAHWLHHRLPGYVHRGHNSYQILKLIHYSILNNIANFYKIKPKINQAKNTDSQEAELETFRAEFTFLVPSLLLAGL